MLLFDVAFKLQINTRTCRPTITWSMVLPNGISLKLKKVLVVTQGAKVGRS